MIGEALRLAGDDGSGRYNDWRQWGAETDGMDGRTEHEHGRTFIARPVGKAGLSAVSPDITDSLYEHSAGSRLTIRPMDVGEFVLRTSPN